MVSRTSHATARHPVAGPWLPVSPARQLVDIIRPDALVVNLVPTKAVDLVPSDATILKAIRLKMALSLAVIKFLSVSSSVL